MITPVLSNSRTILTSGHVNISGMADSTSSYDILKDVIPLFRTDKGVTSLNAKKNLYMEFGLLKTKRKFTWRESFVTNLTTSEFNCLFRKPDMKGTLEWTICLGTVYTVEIEYFDTRFAYKLSIKIHSSMKIDVYTSDIL